MWPAGCRATRRDDEERVTGMTFFTDNSFLLFIGTLVAVIIVFWLVDKF